MTLLARASKALALGGGGLGLAAAYRYQCLKSEESNLPTQEIWRFPSSSGKGKNDDDNKTNKKNVIVIGGGVVGVTAAYKLALKGHSVALLEPRSRPGKECSACAAGGMQRSNPVVDVGTWIAVTKQIFPLSRFVLGGGSHEPYNFFHICWWTCLSDPFFLRWVGTFTKTSFFPAEDQVEKQREMLKFTDFAVRDMITMMKKEDGEDNMAQRSGWNNRGSLSLSYDSSVPPASTGGQTKTKTVNPSQSYCVLEPSMSLKEGDIVEKEPSILHQEKRPTVAKYEYEASAASSERFTEELARRCADDPNLDVTFLYNTSVKAVDTAAADGAGGGKGDEKSRVTRLRTNRGVINVPEGTEVVVAAGAWTPHVMSLMDLYAPVYPLKGYAMSISATEALSKSKSNAANDDGKDLLKGLKPEDLPSRIVSDKYMYTSRLGDEIRITSVGEFSGWSTSPTPHVEKDFRHEACRQFPQLSSFIMDAETKCGHRPYVSDGILLLGRVDGYENLMVSCGPGSNGWKLAMGSGEIVERLARGMSEEDISSELGFDAMSFSPKGRVRRAPVFAKLCRARWNV